MLTVTSYITLFTAAFCDHLFLQDAWLEAESAAAAKQVEAILYSESGWGPGQTLLLEDGRPAWHADLWPPKAAEEVRGCALFV
jgi:hypothetical protein